MSRKQKSERWRWYCSADNGPGEYNALEREPYNAHTQPVLTWSETAGTCCIHACAEDAELIAQAPSLLAQRNALLAACKALMVLAAAYSPDRPAENDVIAKANAIIAKCKEM